jgi:hypothetical protein
MLSDSGGGTPTPIQGSDLEVSFNPTVHLTVLPQESLAALLSRLAEAINQAGLGLYVAAVLEPGVLEIRKSGGAEIDDLRFLENDAAIQSMTLTVSRPGLVAQVREPQEDPSSGAIVLTLNDRAVSVDVSGLDRAAAVQALLEAIRRADFVAEFTPPFILVSRDLKSGGGLERVGWRTTDTVLVSSDLALLPEPVASPLIPALGPRGAVALTVVLALAGALLLRRRRAAPAP